MCVQREVIRCELYARDVFECSPESLYVDGFAAVKLSLDNVRAG